MMLRYLRMAVRSLGRKRFRSWLTIGAVAVGVTSVVAIACMGHLGKEQIQQELDQLGLGSVMLSVQRKDTGVTLSNEDYETVQKLPEVDGALPVLMQYTQSRACGLVTQCAVWGIGAGAEQVIALQLLHGRMVSAADVAEAGAVCIVDESYARTMYRRSNIVGKEIVLTLDGQRQTFTVIGVVRSGGGLLQGMLSQILPTFLYLPYTTMQAAAGSDALDLIAVQLDEGCDPAAASERMVQLLDRRKGGEGLIRGENVAAQKENLGQVLNLVSGILTAVAAISLVVAGLGMMTVMLVSVNERTREIGVKKAIGAGRGTILLEFLTEAMLLTLTGSLLGLLFGFGGAAITAALLQLPFHLDPAMAGGLLLFAMGIGLLFGAYPAYRAAGLHPVEALRRE